MTGRAAVVSPLAAARALGAGHARRGERIVTTSAGGPAVIAVMCGADPGGPGALALAAAYEEAWCAQLS